MELRERNKLIIDNLPLVERLAKHKTKNSIPQVLYDDLVSVGNQALVEAADKFDNTKGIFEVFVLKSIIGAMKDYTYEILHWGKRNHNRYKIRINSVDDLDENNPSLIYPNNDSVIQLLSESGQKLLRLYYIDGFTYKEIGEQLGVSESRVAQRIYEFRDKLLSKIEEVN